MISFVIATMLMVTSLALDPPKEDPDKVSNDQPGRPLQMPPASTEVKEALDDFDRFKRRNAWERALKALYTIPEEQTLRFVDGENGFILPVARQRRSLLGALPAEGQAAYRLFYDAEAKKLYEEAEGPSELKNLERVYSAYFVSSVGDNAADRLGDLYFEAGRFDRAADCWLAILRERPDTDLSLGLISVKAALALSRSGRKSEHDQVRAELKEKYADGKVVIGGESALPLAHLRRLLGDEPEVTETAKPDSSASSKVLAANGTIDPVWQMRIADSVEAGMTPPELTQWQTNGLSAVVPAATVEGSKLFANFLGYIFSVNLTTGKLLWRSASFHHVKLFAMQNQGPPIDASRFAIAASGDFLWSLGRDLRDQNFIGALRPYLPAV